MAWAAKMHSFGAPRQPRSFPTGTQLPIPFLQINGETIDRTTSQPTSAITSSDDSYTIYDNQNHNFRGHGTIAQPVSPSRNYVPDAHVTDSLWSQLSFEEHQGPSNRPDSTALSGVGSVHGSYDVLSDQQIDQTRVSPNAPINNPHFDLRGWHNVPTICPATALPLPTQGGSKSPSDNSDSFSFIDSECAGCQTKDGRLGQLEKQLKALSQDLHEYQRTMRDQHAVIKEQQLIILELQRIKGNEQKAPSQKRVLPMEEDKAVNAASNLAHGTSPNDTPSKRGRFAPQQRKQTAETRQKGACVRCWKHKQRCEPGEGPEDPCKSCRESSLSRIRMPCIRTHIVDLNIFRRGNGRNDTWTVRDDVLKSMDLTTYASEDRKQLMLTQGFGPLLEVKARMYRLVGDDVTVYTWRDSQGKVREKPMPPYALSDIEELISNVKLYIKENQNTYIEQFISKDDVPTWQAFKIAREMTADGENTMLQEALQLWTAARLIEKPWQICGDETLELQADTHWWWIPVTPIMDTQLDQVVIKSCLLPWRKSVLQKLQVKVERACRKSWLEIFITIVILLNTIEEATRHDHEFAAFFGHEFEPGRKRFEDYDLIESYFHSALTLLTHVKVAFDGRLPYVDAKTDVSKLMKACQGENERDYMIEIDRYVSERKRKIEFDKIRERHQYEAKQFWVHQLFVKEWDGRPISIREKH